MKQIVSFKFNQLSDAFHFRSDFLKANEYFRDHYMQTYARFPPYLIGILVGWILYNTNQKKQIFLLNKVIQCFQV